MITMNNSHNIEPVRSSSMHLGVPPPPTNFSAGVFHSRSASPPVHLSFDAISPLTPPTASPSDSTSLDSATNNDSPTFPSQSDIPYSCGSMFSSCKNFGRFDLLNSPSTGIRGHTYNSRNILIDNLTGKQNFNKALLPPRRAKAALDSGLIDQEFTRDEAKKIMANEKLGEMALADPKRVRRILANRQSAARSKEKKMRYVMELEHKVHLLHTENIALSAQLTHLQRESAGLVSRNNELRIRLKALGQQSQLQNVLNEALKAEVQRLKLEVEAREITPPY